MRKSAGLTQGQLAEMVGFQTGRSIRRLERGEYLPTVERQVDLATIFSITVDELMGSNILTGAAEVVRRLRPYVIAHVSSIGQETRDLQKQILALKMQPILCDSDRHAIEILTEKLECTTRYLVKVWDDLCGVGG